MKKTKRFLTIFLDVDGVLNKEGDWRSQFSLNEECVNAFVSLWNDLSKIYIPSLVIVSTWRAGKGKEQNTDSYNYLENTLRSHGIKILGLTPVSNKGRQNEIDYYRRWNHVMDYIIIDDDISLYEHPEDVLIFCPDYKTGLTMKDIKVIKRMIVKHPQNGSMWL